MVASRRMRPVCSGTGYPSCEPGPDGTWRSDPKTRPSLAIVIVPQCWAIFSIHCASVSSPPNRFA